MQPHLSDHWHGIVMTQLTVKNTIHHLEGLTNLLQPSLDVFLDGCDRAIPNERRSRLPGLHNLRLLLLRPRHGLSSSVPLLDVLPNAPQPERPQGQEDVSACEGPCHA